jgi:glycosyltransferase involved in cell wall biosynthesis
MVRMNKFPRILIIGQPFNDVTGGGITISNLFRGWPSDRIAVAATGHMLYYVTTDICDTYYQLGNEEHRWIFPFSLIQRSFPSGPRIYENKDTVSVTRHISTWRFEFVNHVFYPILSWIGLIHVSSRISLSPGFRKWLEEFKPDILYLQVSSRETIRFASDLVRYLNIPSAIHIMDDWPSTISNKGLFKRYWKKKIHREFQQLLDIVDLHLSISDAMSVEYQKRYNKNFVAFHNPTDLNIWLPHCKKDFTIRQDNIRILYSGRIGIGIADSLIEVAEAIDRLNTEDLKIRLFIQTPTEEQSILDRLSGYACVIINPVAGYDQLPAIFADADLLLLANDFNKDGITYLKYSMPTKASEYMISGTPILVYAPEGAAVYQAIEQNECGYCLNRQGSQGIMEAIRFLCGDEEYRKRISNNAVNYARRKFDAMKVRDEFRNKLISITPEMKRTGDEGIGKV